jgi:hypothetical protein
MDNLKRILKEKLSEAVNSQNTEDELKDTVDVVKRELDVDDPEAKEVVAGMYGVDENVEAGDDTSETDDKESQTESIKPRMTKANLQSLIENNLKK